MADYAKLREERNEPFVLREFMVELNAIGSVRIALVRWQMTALDDEIQMLTSQY